MEEGSEEEIFSGFQSLNFELTTQGEGIRGGAKSTKKKGSRILPKELCHCRKFKISNSYIVET